MFAGLNVLESRELALEVAGQFKQTCDALSIPYVFKASFDKANRSSLDSFRGPGIDEGLRWLSDVKDQLEVQLENLKEVNSHGTLLPPCVHKPGSRYLRSVLVAK